MLLQYDVENNLSIHNRQRIAFIADKKKENIDCTVEIAGFSTIPVIAVYGKNASGKTNLLKGLKHIYDMVIYSHSFDPFEGIPFYEPFKFTDKQNEESKFEISFIVNKKRYTYGFSHNNKEILEEYLYVFNSQKPTKIFDKELKAKKYSFGKDYGELEEYVSKTHKNKLLLSTTAQWAADQPEINAIYKFFKNGMIYYQKDCVTIATEFDNETTKLLVNDKKARVFLKKLIKYLDLEIIDIEAKKIDIDTLPQEIREVLERLKSAKINPADVKTVYNINGKKYTLDITEESNGVQKLYQLFPLIYHGLTSKKIIIIDEIETALHPLLVRGLISLFQDRKINKYNSQLLFTTHLPAVLNLKLLRRDEIWFAERSAETDYSTEVFSLADIRGVRITDNIEREYLDGRYSRIPEKNLWADVHE